MRFHRVVLIALLVTATAWAQSSQGGHERCTLRLDVIYAKGGHGPAKLRVQVMQGMNGAPVAVALTTSSGTAEFSELTPGSYHVVVSGDGIETADSGTFSISDWDTFISRTVVIQTTTQSKPASPKIQPADSKISASDLSISPKAMNEYDRGNEEMANKNWAKAIEHFNRAISMAPSFSAAYNNLAVCYGQMGQQDEERKALETAISRSDRCLSCLLNLGHLDLQEGNVAGASPLLDKALTIDPDNVEALSYVAELNFAQGQYDKAVAAARKAHGMPHKNYAVVHFTAARAFEHEGRIADAMAELQLFLQEAPDSPRADMARKALVAMQSQQH
jgi:Tfp pilus assembly protein PilF